MMFWSQQRMETVNRRHLHRLEMMIKSLKILSGLILTFSFIVYFILLHAGDYFIDNEEIESIIATVTFLNNNIRLIELPYLNLSPEWLVNIWLYGIFISAGLLFRVIGIEEKNKFVKVLIYYNISSFFILLLMAYSINDILDFYLNAKFVINCFILTTIICLIYYLYLLFKR